MRIEYLILGIFIFLFIMIIVGIVFGLPGFPGLIKNKSKEDLDELSDEKNKKSQK